MSQTTNTTVNPATRPTAVNAWAVPARVVQQVAPPLVTLLVVLAAWELLVFLFKPSVLLLPPPHQILETLLADFGMLLRYGYNTFRQAIAGFALGCSAGILVALVTARWQALADFVMPLAVASNAVPIIALAPLAIVWFGIDEGSKIAIVALLCFFPTLVSTVQGLRAAPTDAVDLMRSYAASEWQTFAKLRVPTALPYLFNAFKICATLSMIGAIVAEFFGGSTQFLGVYIKTEASILHTRDAWAAIVMACLIGIAFYLVVAAIERLAMPWHVTHRKRTE